MNLIYIFQKGGGQLLERGAIFEEYGVHHTPHIA